MKNKPKIIGKCAVPRVKKVWDDVTASSRGTMCWDGVSGNKPQTLYFRTVPAGRDLGTEGYLVTPSRPTLSLGWDDGTMGRQRHEKQT